MSEDKFLTNEGDSVAQVPVEQRTATEVPKVEEAPVVSAPPKVREFNCPTCRKVVPEDKAMKLFLDYVREENGALGKSEARYSLFCPTCQHFLAIVDTRAAAELKSIINKK